jgi:uncharacterized protein YdhG (YjbR/CyaY superfamily)
MASSTAATVDDYLASLPEERREVMAAIRKLVRKSLPKGYEEQVGYGMVCYVIPLEKYSETYNGQPLCYVALAAQKHHYALYLTGPYAQPKLAEGLREAFEAAGKKLDMGKSCLRFKKLDDLPLDAVGKVIAAVPPQSFIDVYEQNRSSAKASRR